MESGHQDPRLTRRAEGVDPAGGAEPSLGELLRRLTTDTGELVRQEVELAKAEMRDVGATLARDAAKIGAGLALALAGAGALTAFLVILLGNALGNHWLAALIVGVAFVAIGGVLARNAVNDVKERGLKPAATIDSLRENADWAKQEARAVKRELTATPRAD